jgi:ATP-dependent DNA ligase
VRASWSLPWSRASGRRPFQRHDPTAAEAATPEAHWYTGSPMFIPSMLCTTLRDLSRLGDPRYLAEPKFDGQRAQVHVAGGRTVAAYSRGGPVAPRARGPDLAP